MRISITVTSYPDDTTSSPLGSYLADIAQAADGAGVDTVWVADHLQQSDPARSVDEAMLEAYTTLGFLARATTRVRLGTMVAAATYRTPALLVKAVTTLDVLSGGRGWLGIGAGYQADEAAAMGLYLPAVAERFARLAETLEIARRMFADDSTPYSGAHYTLDKPVNRPQPATRPHPPILIGGAGEQKTLPLVARYADACNLFDIPDNGATLGRKLEILRRHCDDLHRDFATIDRTVSTRWSSEMSIDELAAHLESLATWGATHAVLLRSEPWRLADLDALADLTDQSAASP